MRTFRIFFLWAMAAASTPFVTAGVYLTSYNFPRNSLPQIYTDENLPQPYKLRAKFAGNYHAVNGWNNNWQTLESVPGTGWTTVELYWVKYASDWVTVLEIGPFHPYSVYISSPNSAPTSSLSASPTGMALTGHVTLTSTITDPDGNLSNQAVDVSTDGVNYTSGWNNWSGQTAWYISGSNDTRSVAYTPPSTGMYYFRSRGIDTAGVLSSFSYATVSVQAVSFDWGSTPAMVGAGANYNVNVVANIIGIDAPYVILYKAGAYMAGGSYGTQANTSDPNPGTVSYSATASYFPSGAFASSSRAVTVVASHPPRNMLEFWAKDGSQHYGSTGVWNDPNENGGLLYNPGFWAPGETMTIRLVARDSDGNAQSIRFIATNKDGIVINDDTRTATNPADTINTGNNLGLDIPVTFNQGPGRYFLRQIATDTTGLTDSDYWYVDVGVAARITGFPQSQTASQGQSVTFSVITEGSVPISYQWRKNGNDIAGATNASFSLGSVQIGDAGTYTCYVSNPFGGDSASAVLTVSSAPVITSHPQSLSIYAGQTAMFTIGATGEPAPGYQWRKNGGNLSNGGNISGANSATLVITNVQVGDAGAYTCYVNNALGSATSNGATLAIVGAPIITSATSASGTVGLAFNYQIIGSNSPTSYGASGLPSGLTINTGNGVISGTPAVASTYNITISATNSAGTGSATLVLTIGTPSGLPVITSATTASGAVGSPFSYVIVASGSPTSYNAANLPAGLSVNTGTGVISGTPTATGTFNVIISATNGGGTGSATLVITISSGIQDDTNQNQLNIHLPY